VRTNAAIQEVTDTSCYGRSVPQLAAAVTRRVRRGRRAGRAHGGAHGGNSSWAITMRFCGGAELRR